MEERFLKALEQASSVAERDGILRQIAAENSPRCVSGAVGGAISWLFGGALNAAEHAVLKQAKKIEAERSARAAERGDGGDGADKQADKS